MKIFALADIHGDFRYFDKIGELIQSADVVVIAGDITKTGKAVSAEKILSRIESLNKNIIAVHGNWDKGDVLDLLEVRGYSVHSNVRIINNVAFFGVGGSAPTLMNTETEYTEEEIYEFLKNGYNRIKQCKKTVLVTHSPPKDVRDTTYLRLHAGSLSVRDFIKEMQVDVCITGHIHEAYGVEEYSECTVLNTGSFKKGRYGLVTFNNDTLSVTVSRVRRFR